MRALFICLLVVSSGCVKRVVNVPKEFGTPPAGTPENAVAVNFDSDRDGRQWQILAGSEAPCLTPCSLWVDPTQTIHFRSSAGEHMYLGDLDYRLQGAKHGVVVAEGESSGLFVNGVVWTTFGGMGVVTAITLSAVGCSDTSRRGGMCTAGLITAGVSIPLMVSAIWMLVSSGPQAHVFPVFQSKSAPVSVTVTPTGIVGAF